MGKVVFRKFITSTDVKYHFVTVPKDSFHPDSTITLLVEGKRKHAYIDTYLRLKLGARIFEILGIDKVGDILVLEEVKPTIFRAIKEGSKGADLGRLGIEFPPSQTSPRVLPR